MPNENQNDNKKKKNNGRLRVEIIAVFALLTLLATFFAYMLDTSLEDVLADERGENVIITHTDSEA